MDLGDLGAAGKLFLASALNESGQDRWAGGAIVGQVLEQDELHRRLGRSSARQVRGLPGDEGLTAIALRTLLGTWPDHELAARVRALAGTERRGLLAEHAWDRVRAARAPRSRASRGPAGTDAGRRARVTGDDDAPRSAARRHPAGGRRIKWPLGAAPGSRSREPAESGSGGARQARQGMRGHDRCTTRCARSRCGPRSPAEPQEAGLILLRRLTPSIRASGERKEPPSRARRPGIRCGSSCRSSCRGPRPMSCSKTRCPPGSSRSCSSSRPPALARYSHSPSASGAARG